MTKKKQSLVERLEKFCDEWVSNSAARLEFVRIVEAVHLQAISDHADHELLTWIDEERDGARYIGID